MPGVIKILVSHEQHLVLQQRGLQPGEDRVTDVAEAHAVDLSAKVAGDPPHADPRQARR